MRFLISTLLSAAAFLLVFPHLQGVSFEGGIFAALLMALVTAGTALFFRTAGRALTLTLRIRTVLPASAVLIPVWLLGVWLVPAAELSAFGHLFPSALALAGWKAALTASGVLLLINIGTHRWSEALKKPCECN
jgi:hypothetical protein